MNKSCEGCMRDDFCLSSHFITKEGCSEYNDKAEYQRKMNFNRNHADNNCSKCIHKNVCPYKDKIGNQFDTIYEALKPMQIEKLINKPFNFRLYCTEFKEDK